MTRFPALVGRYLYPARIIPPTREHALNVGRSLVSSYRAGATAALPSAVGLDVSDVCNIACAICSREIDWDKRDNALLKLDRFVHIYDQIRPSYLSLSGYGETLLNKAVPAMIAHATKAGSRVTLVSNGTLLDEVRADALVTAGLAKLKISIDAADPALYAKVRERANLPEVLANIERLVMMRDARRLPDPEVELQCTLFRDNIDEITPLIELCHRRLPGIQPYFHIMFTYGEQDKFVEKTLAIGDSHAIGELDRGISLARRYGYLRTCNALETAKLQLTTDLSNAPCFIPWYSCIVSTDGDVYPCCYHTIRGTKVGNAFETPFIDIWNGAPMQAFRTALRTKRCADQVCASCRYEDRPMDQVFGLVAKVPGLATYRG